MDLDLGSKRAKKLIRDHDLTEDEILQIVASARINLDSSSEHEARERVEAMCRQLLANHVIEDFRFDIEPERKRR